MCLNADGSPNTDPAITNPAQCTGTLQPNPGFVPLLGCYDLTRTEHTAGERWLLHSNQRALHLPRPRRYQGTRRVYCRTTLTIKNWNLNLGLRGDLLQRNHRREPGRATARRRLQHQENQYSAAGLLCSNAGNAIQREPDPFEHGMQRPGDQRDHGSITQGYPCITASLEPRMAQRIPRRLQQAFGRYLVVDGEYIWKYTHNAYDFSVLATRRSHFRSSGHNSKIPELQFDVRCRTSTD